MLASAVAEPLLESSDVAKIIDRSVATVHRLTEAGHLEVVARTLRGTRLYARADAMRLAKLGWPHQTEAIAE